jgi:hypothetical protein
LPAAAAELDGGALGPKARPTTLTQRFLSIVATVGCPASWLLTGSCTQIEVQVLLIGI